MAARTPAPFRTDCPEQTRNRRESEFGGRCPAETAAPCVAGCARSRECPGKPLLRLTAIRAVRFAPARASMGTMLVWT